MRVRDVSVNVTSTGASAMLLDVGMSQQYRHSLGWSSPFFIGISEHVLRATSCEVCSATFFPPRQYCSCSNDLSQTRWYDLPGTGTVTAASIVHSPPPFGGIEAPYVLASIRLDGVDGGITHRVLGTQPPACGATVAVKFLEGPHAHPLLAISFALDEGPAT